MDTRKWKKENKPASCTEPPWAMFIPVEDRPNVLRQIRQETIEEYGYSMDECPKRKICIKKECLGRPLPWKSKTAKPLLEKLKNFSNIKNEELIVNTDCRSCPMFNNCDNLCNQVLDFIDRGKSMEVNIKYTNNNENEIVKKIDNEAGKLLVSSEDIPWDVLSVRKRKIVKQYLYEQKNFKHVADNNDLYNQAFAKYEFYAALTKLSEYANLRKFLKENSHVLTLRQHEILNMVYFQNKRIVQVAKDLQISKQSVQQTISRVTKKYNIKWHTFVKKQGNKMIYNTMEVLKQ